MLFENDGSNGTVILQWINRDYLIHDKKEYRKKIYKQEIEGTSWFDRSKRKEIKREVYSDYEDELKELERIIVGPDEFAIVIKDGVIESTYTQKQVDELPGFWKRMAERLAGGKEDIQIILADTRKHQMDIPFSAFTSDRVQVKGTVQLFASINKDDVALTLRILKEIVGSRVNEKIGFRQLTVDDVKELISENLNYIIDTESIGDHTASQIEKDRKGICLDLISALNTKTPYWANYGLSVYYSSIEFNENRWEDLERQDAENKLNRRQMDIEFLMKESEAGDRIRIDELMEHEKAMMTINGKLAEYGSEIVLSSKKKELEVAKIDDEAEIEMTRLEAQSRYEKTLAYHMKELRRLQDYDIDDTEKELKITEIKARIQKIELENEEARYELELRKLKDSRDLEESSKDSDVERQIRLMEAKAAAVRAMAAGDEEIRKMEIARGIDEQRQQAEIEKVKAESKLEGYMTADDRKHQQHMDELAMTRDMLGAANKGNPQNVGQIKCPKCNKYNPSTGTFCTGCGTRLKGGDE